ncbi:glycosyltransferase [Alicyclobacillus sendaiensis]|uniref:Glycosyltransferase n=1 Tax=Alicyclobacillus sendaiensis PA2 TaxID=3029425 RepID=A0ABT6Y0U0_ALISE|nr:glycosyltransferase [Alicyclobacillus sendaiensis]MDI9260937.1 glycosyltransferase [Alicyclobacillus sendaiensis PA2]
MTQTSTDRDSLTSIIILTHNRLAETQACVESIRRYTKPGTYEIVVVDNNSTDGTRAWLASQPDIHTILNNENLGFPAGCNQGIRMARGNTIVLLNNDTVVTPRWLDNLLTCLYSADDIGAVGPVTNHACYYQAISVPYRTMEEMHQFAEQYNHSNPQKWERRLKLIGFCFVVKRTVLDKVGLLDERFSPGHFEDDDLSLRILQAGYQLVLCRDTFIHHHGSATFVHRDDVQQVVATNSKKFRDKWGFDSHYSLHIRYDVLQLMNQHPRDKELKVLEIGCACGATLLQVRNLYPNARLYGVELNPNAASIATLFADVQAMDIEENIHYEKEFFDYIIFADVLEHLYDPWNVVRRFREHLAPGGVILASIPNVMHISVIRDLVNGNWNYTDVGLLDRTHVRFFTLNTIDRMFADAGYSNREYAVNVSPLTELDKAWVRALTNVSEHKNETLFTAYQYLCRVTK